jgi:2-polyprenyl-3-methyl-5-hydroxy-6-metoxy-1,4-benzoquinol methylase
MDERCHICDAQMQFVFSAQILGRHDVRYFHCAECGFLRTEAPYWLDEAYSDAIAVTDTGVMVRNLLLADKLAVFLRFCFERNARYLDVAGGYGILTRLMRDYGFDFYWEDKHCQNLVARGFEYQANGLPLSAMTAFEVLEHVPDPYTFLRELMTTYECRTLIFTTRTYSGGPPDPDWWYYSRVTGQHISFFQRRTLQVLAKRLGLSLFACGEVLVMSDRPLSTAARLVRTLDRWATIPVSWWMRKRLVSRTIADHLQLTEKIDANRKYN